MSFFAKDLNKFHAFLVQRGDVEVLQAPKKECWGGSKASYKAPDGAHFSVAECDPSMQGTCSSETCSDSDKKESKTKQGGICHLEIPCEDVARGTKFYGDVFGWSFTVAPEGSTKTDMQYHLFDTHCTEYPLKGGLYKEKDKSARIKFAAVYLLSSDIIAHCEKIKSAGGEVILGKTPIPCVGYFAHFRDTEGNTMALYSCLEKI